MDIRDVQERDIECITAIHNHAIEHTTAIWSGKRVDTADRLAWLVRLSRAGRGGRGGAVLGYASFADWRAFEGYRHTVEHSVYVRATGRAVASGAP